MPLGKLRGDGARQVRTGIFKLPNGKYQIEWRDEYNQRHQETLSFNFRAAEDAYSKKLTLRAEKRTLDIKKLTPHGFAWLADKYIKDYAKPKKASWYGDFLKARKYFKPFFGNTPIQTIKKEHITDYASRRLAQGANGGTINKEITILRTMFEQAIDWEYIDRNPCRKWEDYPENGAKTEYLQFGEVQQLTDAVERLLAKDKKGKGWRAFHLKQFQYLIPLAFDTGGRRDEIIRLNDDLLDMNARLIAYKFKKGKKREEKIRWVPMTERVYSMLKEMPRNLDTPYLFPDENGRLWRSKKSFYRCFDMILKEANIKKDVNFHMLRHSYNTHLALNGVDEKARMELMGHTSHVTQDRYTHLTNEHKRKAAQILDGLRDKASEPKSHLNINLN